MDITGICDKNGMPIFVGDILKHRDGYRVVVQKGTYGFFGKLVCNPSHPCALIPYSLNNKQDWTLVPKENK